MKYEERPKCYIAREKILFDLLPALTINNLVHYSFTTNYEVGNGLIEIPDHQ